MQLQGAHDEQHHVMKLNGIQIQTTDALEVSLMKLTSWWNTNVFCGSLYSGKLINLKEGHWILYFL